MIKLLLYHVAKLLPFSGLRITIFTAIYPSITFIHMQQAATPWFNAGLRPVVRVDV